MWALIGALKESDVGSQNSFATYLWSSWFILMFLVLLTACPRTRIIFSNKIHSNKSRVTRQNCLSFLIKKYFWCRRHCLSVMFVCCQFSYFFSGLTNLKYVAVMKNKKTRLKQISKRIRKINGLRLCWS